MTQPGATVPPPSPDVACAAHRRAGKAHTHPTQPLPYKQAGIPEARQASRLAVSRMPRQGTRQAVVFGGFCFDSLQAG